MGNAVGNAMGNAIESVGLNDSKKDDKYLEGEKIKCNKCGNAIPKGAKFCLECGEKIEFSKDNDMVTCPNCKREVVKAKFCLECGFKFITNCSECGASLIPGAKFCLECGKKVI